MGTSTPSAPGQSALGPPSPIRTAPGLGEPLFVLNLKTYPDCLGPGALRVAGILETLASEAGVASAVAPAMPDIGQLAGRLSIPVLGQHVDVTQAGPGTGFVPVEALRASGARGSLVNHSEHPIPAPSVRTAVEHLASAGLSAVVCARTVDEARSLAAFEPPYLAVEPPELIGGKVSVSEARPALISSTVAAVREVAPGTRVLCGAGIHDRRDVARAIELGSVGILVASAVAKSPDPARAIRDLLSGF